MVAILGFAGSGKTKLLAITALLFIAHPDIGRIYCSAPTHVATSNFAERLHRVGGEISKKCSMSAPLVVRRYAIETEIAAFIKIATRRSRGADADMADPYRATRWSLKLSPCEWLLKVVGAGDFRLAPTDSHVLHKLREQFLTERQYDGLRRFVASEISFEAVESSTTKGAMSGSASDLVKELLVCIVMNAHAVCTTPYASGESIYAEYNVEVAKGVILDEASAMLQGDALLVSGPRCRPCGKAGDPRQLPPAVMTEGEKRNGKCANNFSRLAKISVLEQVKRNGWPCFAL